MNDRPESVRIALAARLNELEGSFLHVSCTDCKSNVSIPVRLLATKHGPLHQLGAVIIRLVCRRCRRKPTTVHLAETQMLNFCYGGRPGWNVQLFPLDG